MLHSTAELRSQSLSEDVNNRIRMWTQSDIEHYREHPDEINKRLDELNREWSVERILQTNASILALVGALLGAFRHRNWFILSAVPSVFLLLHGLTGWAPPIEGMRRMGLRTSMEVDEERCALLEMKGE